MEQRVSELEQRVAVVETNQKQHFHEIEKNRIQLSVLEKTVLTNSLDHKKLMEHQAKIELAVAELKDNTGNVLDGHKALITKIMIALVIIVLAGPEAKKFVLGFFGIPI